MISLNKTPKSDTTPKNKMVPVRLLYFVLLIDNLPVDSGSGCSDFLIQNATLEFIILDNKKTLAELDTNLDRRQLAILIQRRFKAENTGKHEVVHDYYSHTYIFRFELLKDSGRLCVYSLIDSFTLCGSLLATECRVCPHSHLKHLQQRLLGDLKPLKWLLFFHHGLTQSLQVPKLSAGYSSGNEKLAEFTF